MDVSHIAILHTADAHTGVEYHAHNAVLAPLYWYVNPLFVLVSKKYMLTHVRM